jgi:hypothetical protein
VRATITESSAPRADTHLGRPQKEALVASLLLLGLVSVKAFGNLGRKNPLLGRFPWLASVVEPITQITVLQADYGFFSPNIASDTRVEVTVALPGSDFKPVPPVFPNREVKLRFHTSTAAFKAFGAYREILARSMAAKVYTTHPDAAFIVVTAYDYRLPSMAAFRQGQRPSEEVFFRASFSTSNGRKEN